VRDPEQHGPRSAEHQWRDRARAARAGGAIRCHRQRRLHHRLVRADRGGNPKSTKTHIICDNARYFRSKEVRSFLEDSKIELVFLPPYSPNLNLIERYWKFFKKKILYNSYYDTFWKFKKACIQFFKNWNEYTSELRSLMTENFQITGN